jgi:lipoprotein signal peptidase
MKKQIMKKQKPYRLISFLTILVGLLLMIYMIKVEDEPGALPLLLIILGTVGLLLNKKIKF